MEMGMKKKGMREAYFDPNYNGQINQIPAPGVCIDNETSECYTLIKVDSANKHGSLLEIAQLIADVDLVIAKAYIASDGGWFFDVFYVTDQLGNKLSDPTIIEYIQQWLVKGPRASGFRKVRTCLGKLVGTDYLAAEHTALEMTATDRPGLLSEIFAVLVELDCHVLCMQSWTHNGRFAAILYLADSAISHHVITHPARLAEIESQVDIVVAAHELPDKVRRVKVTGPVPFRVHTERRLHQLMLDDCDYEAGPLPLPVHNTHFCIAAVRGKKATPSATKIETRVSIENWNQKNYSVVTISSKERPKLLFDIVCTLTDMNYTIYHASVSSHEGEATQEYFVRHIDGRSMDTEAERERVSRCLAAAIQRRLSNGVRIEMAIQNRQGLLADVTRVYREKGLSLMNAECATRGKKAVGAFYVADMSVGDVDPKTVEAMIGMIGGSVTLEMNSSRRVTEECSRSSLGSLLWSR